MGDLSAALSAYSLPLSLLIGLTLLTTIYLAYRESINFHAMDFLYGLPLVGKLASLSRDHSKSQKTGWLIAEETLCSDYKKHVSFISEREFLQRTEYLRKAGDTGRKPLSALLMLMLGFLIAAEALGFSFLLSTSMAQEGSANLHTVMTFAITSVIAVVFALIMHAAGHQLHRAALIGPAERARQADGSTLELKDIDLAKDQSIDDPRPECDQLLSRVGRNKSYSAVVAAVILIVAVAGGSTYMRIQHLNSTLIQEAVNGSDSGGNPFAQDKVAVPDEAKAPEQEALQRAKAESAGAAKGEGYAAFVVLGVIFVFTQFVGVMFGMKYGFAGRQGKEAYALTLGAGTYDEYVRAFAPRVHKAEARLRNLQQRIAASATAKALVLHGDFQEFLRRNQFTGLSTAQPSAPAAVASSEPAPVAAPVIAPLPPAPAPVAAQPAAAAPAAPADVAPEVASEVAVPSLERALAHLDTLADVEQKKLYTVSLPAGLRAQVVEEMKARKARAAALSELDDVF